MNPIDVFLFIFVTLLLMPLVVVVAIMRYREIKRWRKHHDHYAQKLKQHLARRNGR